MLTLAATLALLAVLGAVLLRNLGPIAVALAALGPTAVNPALVQKSHVISTVSAISATTFDADDNGGGTTGYFEVPRGANRIGFVFLSTLNTGFSTGSVYMTGQIWGCDTPNGTYYPIPSTITAELVVDVPQYLPTAANAVGITLPRFIKVKWVETGSMSSFTASCTMFWEDAGGAGKQASFDNLGG